MYATYLLTYSTQTAMAAVNIHNRLPTYFFTGRPHSSSNWVCTDDCSRVPAVDIGRGWVPADYIWTLRRLYYNEHSSWHLFFLQLLPQSQVKRIINKNKYILYSLLNRTPLNSVTFPSPRHSVMLHMQVPPLRLRQEVKCAKLSSSVTRRKLWLNGLS